MALNIPVKAGAISNLTDARFFAAFEVDMLGFCFDPQSENYISPQEAIAIAGWISGPKIVAEFANQDEENVRNIISFLQPDIVQLDSTYAIEFVNTFSDDGKEIILDLTSTSEHTIPDFLDMEQILFFLVTEKQFAEHKDQLPENTLVIIHSANQLSSYSAIQINGTPEKQTGVKLFETEGEILESISD